MEYGAERLDVHYLHPWFHTRSFPQSHLTLGQRHVGRHSFFEPQRQLHVCVCIFCGRWFLSPGGTAAAAPGLLRSGRCAGRPSPLKVSCWGARKTQKGVLSVENVWQLGHRTIESIICHFSLPVLP